MKGKIILVLMALLIVTVSNAQKNTIPIPTILNEMNFYNKAKNSLQALEKGKTEFVTKAKGLGFGGAATNFELPGDKSPVRFANMDTLTFVVTLGDGMGEPSAWFNLFKADIKKGKRIANWVNTKLMGKNSSGDNIITFSVRKIGDNAFQVIPSQKLTSGEYVFISKGTMSTYGGRNADAFAFGVD